MWIVEIIHYTGYAEFLVWALATNISCFIYIYAHVTRVTCLR